MLPVRAVWTVPDMDPIGRGADVKFQLERRDRDEWYFVTLLRRKIDAALNVNTVRVVDIMAFLCKNYIAPKLPLQTVKCTNHTTN